MPKILIKNTCQSYNKFAVYILGNFIVFEKVQIFKRINKHKNEFWYITLIWKQFDIEFKIKIAHFFIVSCLKIINK